MKRKISDLERKISDFKNEISDLESEIRDLKSEIGDLKSEIRDFERNKDSENSIAQSALKDDIKSVRNLINTYYHKIDTYYRKIDTYYRKIDTYYRNIDTLRNTEIKFFQKRIVSLDNQICEYQKKLTDMKVMPPTGTPSTYSKWDTTIDELTGCQKIFYDSHALAMYDALSALEADDIVQDGILSKMQGYLDCCKSSEYFEKVLTSSENNFHEHTFSTIAAVHLDNYLQSHFTNVKAFHQLPSRGS